MLTNELCSVLLAIMNRLPLEKRTQILGLLVEGNSLRATSRLADVSINTVTKLLVDLGTACAEYHHHNVRNVQAQRVQCDEIWVSSALRRRMSGRKNRLRDGAMFGHGLR